MVHHEAGTCVLDETAVGAGALASAVVVNVPHAPRTPRSPRRTLRKESEYALDIALDRMIAHASREIARERRAASPASKG